MRNWLEKRYHPGRKSYVQALQRSREFDPATTLLLPRTDKDRLLKQIHLETNKISSCLIRRFCNTTIFVLFLLRLILSMVNRALEKSLRRNGRKVRKPAMATEYPPFTFLIKKPLTFVFVRQILFSSIQARFCLNLRGRRRSGSPATTSVDPTKF